MGKKGVTMVAECGPGKVLASLVKRNQPDVQGIALNDSAAVTAARETLS